MVSVDDLLPVMLLLRLAYSGVFPTGGDEAWRLLNLAGDRFDLRRGCVRFNKRLYRVMGHRATASLGAVVAHHQAPLGYVLRQLRAVEQRAKREGSRDAFAINLLKRSGGAVQLTCPWLLPRDAQGQADWSVFSDQSPNLETTPMGQLIRLRDRFAGEDFSRRAAYLTHGWLEDMPLEPAALAMMLGYQFRRQTRGGKQDKETAESLGCRLAELAQTVKPHAPGEFVRDFLAVAEFLARERRVSQRDDLHNARENVA